ncbi:hypothetical protein NDU88_012069 [Pleurodeles waltl]|uniref:Uncharacterized protein n=1 Tax=Pleurodeles waltl TaxID=8319 RepID=A0AAV7R0M0_PLEWA|nr:hypothetical protein NDU88_012069 [Pleurodeles waltl]
MRCFLEQTRIGDCGGMEEPGTGVCGQRDLLERLFVPEGAEDLGTDLHGQRVGGFKGWARIIGQKRFNDSKDKAADDGTSGLGCLRQVYR